MSITVDNRGLGMAYAVPKGTEDSVVDDYGPWQNADVKQVFYQQSSIMYSLLAEIQLIISWRYNASQQYIIEAILDKKSPITGSNCKCINFCKI